MKAAPGRRASRAAIGRPRPAGQRLLDTYASLAARGEHLLHELIGEQVPHQWQHYPDDDAIDPCSGYQWFYHSHAPEDRPDTLEHGHFHLFARRPLWSRRLRSRAERDFAALTGHADRQVHTRHLLAVGINAKGLPISLFTVNSWVTGDLMLSSSGTQRLLACMQLRTGNEAIDTVLESVVALCRDEIVELLARRDVTLATRSTHDVLDDNGLEILSCLPIALDAKLTA